MQTKIKIESFLLKLRLSAKWVNLYIAVTYLAGVIGLLYPYTRELFLQLTPFHLLSSMVILILFQEEWNKPFFFFVVLVLIYGFIIEMLGVNTGLIFGSYKYGDALGLKLFGTPLIIGVNWFLLSYSIGTLVSSLKYKVWQKVFISSFCMMIIDILIEPVAIDLGFWHWQKGDVPVQNYIAWFFSSVVIFVVFFVVKFKKINKISISILMAQIIFFGALFALL